MEIEKTRDEMIADLDAKIEEAINNDVEIEIRDAYLAKAEYFFETKELDNALEFYQKTLEKTAGTLKQLEYNIQIL